jgi:hypothetical protein
MPAVIAAEVLAPALAVGSLGVVADPLGLVLELELGLEVLGAPLG